MKSLIKDSYFKVSIDENSKQTNPSMAIWNAMHKCVDGGSKVIHPVDPIDAVIRYALKFGHFEVLHHATIKLDFDGFPHDTAMQFRTHQDAHTLVQSLRYSDERYSDCAECKIDPVELFYFKSQSDEKIRERDCRNARISCRHYLNKIKEGELKEDARRQLKTGYRQNFTISATFCDWMHIFDRRLLANTQPEAQTAAWMALDLLRAYSGFFEWYKIERAGKNMLAP